MAIATKEQIIADVKKVLPIYNTDLYNDQLNILVAGAMNKLANEGIVNDYDFQSPSYYDYVTCIRYSVAMDMDLDIDINRIQAQYLTRVNTLRTSRL